MASAALLVGSVLSTGGLTALAVKIARSKKSNETETSRCNAKEK
jgi:hypothetical protein